MKIIILFILYPLTFPFVVLCLSIADNIQLIHTAKSKQ